MYCISLNSIQAVLEAEKKNRKDTDLKRNRLLTLGSVVRGFGIGRREGLCATVKQRKAKSQFRVVVWLFLSFERQKRSFAAQSCVFAFQRKKATPRPPETVILPFSARPWRRVLLTRPRSIESFLS